MTVFGDRVFKEVIEGLPWWLSGKEFTCQGSRPGFDPWSGKIQRLCLGLPNRFSVLGGHGLLVASQSPAQLAGNVPWTFAYKMAQGDPFDIPAYL